LLEEKNRNSDKALRTKRCALLCHPDPEASGRNWDDKTLSSFFVEFFVLSTYNYKKNLIFLKKNQVFYLFQILEEIIPCVGRV